MNAVLAIAALTSPLWLMLPMWLVCAHTAPGQRILDGVEHWIGGAR